MDLDFSVLWGFIKICLLALVGFAAYSFYAFFFKGKVIKTKVKPTITWELKGNGQKVDTVFIYTFK